jgi:hypothetical protein
MCSFLQLLFGLTGGFPVAFYPDTIQYEKPQFVGDPKYEKHPNQCHTVRQIVGPQDKFWVLASSY